VTLRDIPLVTGVALVSALAYVVVVALGDLAERLVDPRGSVVRGPGRTDAPASSVTPEVSA
jgi:hypothetical protein